MSSGGRSSSVEGSTDSKVETIARLAQWWIENLDSYITRHSDAFKIVIWNWYLSVEKTGKSCIRLFPEPCQITKDQPLARFVLRVSNSSLAAWTNVPMFPLYKRKVFWTSEDFVWHVANIFQRRFYIEIEFLDLKISSINGGELHSIWPHIKMLHANNFGLICLSRVLEEEFHADVTVNATDGMIKAHKAVISVSSCF